MKYISAYGVRFYGEDVPKGSIYTLSKGYLCQKMIILTDVSELLDGKNILHCRQIEVRVNKSVFVRNMYVSIGDPLYQVFSNFINSDKFDIDKYDKDIYDMNTRITAEYIESNGIRRHHAQLKNHRWNKM